MFVIDITYQVPLEVIDVYLAEHKQFLLQGYAAGHFLSSGRKKPRTGGIIVACFQSRQQCLEYMHRDPFWRHELARYHYIEFEQGFVDMELLRPAA